MTLGKKSVVWVAFLQEAEEWSAQILGIFLKKEDAQAEAKRHSYGRSSAYSMEVK